MSSTRDLQHIELIRSRIRTVPDFPKPGVAFRDITTVLQDAEAWRATIDQLCECAAEWEPDVVVGMESRGFILGATLAYRMGLGFVPARKPGKLPSAVHRVQYNLEYGSDALEIHTDAIGSGHRAVIVDDLLATGGTAAAAVNLVQTCEGEVAGLVFLIELLDLEGRSRLPEDVPVESLISY